MPMVGNACVCHKHNHNAPLDKKVCVDEILLTAELIADRVNPFTNPRLVKSTFTGQGALLANGAGVYSAVADTMVSAAAVGTAA